MAENQYNRATLDDLVRVQLESEKGRSVPAVELQAARDSAHKALDAQLDVPDVLSRSAVRTIYWKHSGAKAPPAPLLPKVKT